MAHKIGTLIIIIASIINLIGIVAMFTFISLKEDGIEIEKKDKNNYNLNNDFTIDNNFDINKKYNNSIHNNNFPQEEIPFNDYNIDKKFIFDSSFYFKSILILNSFSLFFWILLVFSFCVGDRECNCIYCDCACRSGDCNCNNNGDGAKAALICLIFICFALIIYYSLKFCGKHLSRYIVLSCFIFNNLCIFIFSSFIINKYSFYVFEIVMISLSLIIINALFMIIPNISACKWFRFHVRVHNENQIPNINNSAVIYNNGNNYYNNNIYQPNQVNYAGYPNYQIDPSLNYNVYPVPMGKNEYNNDNHDNNDSQNKEHESNNNNEIESNNQIIDDNLDMGNAPLPAHEAQISPGN